MYFFNFGVKIIKVWGQFPGRKSWLQQWGKHHRAQGARLTTCTTAARVAVLQPRDSGRPPYRGRQFPHGDRVRPLLIRHRHGTTDDSHCDKSEMQVNSRKQIWTMSLKTDSTNSSWVESACSNLVFPLKSTEYLYIDKAITSHNKKTTST